MNLRPPPERLTPHPLEGARQRTGKAGSAAFAGIRILPHIAAKHRFA